VLPGNTRILKADGGIWTPPQEVKIRQGELNAFFVLSKVCRHRREYLLFKQAVDVKSSLCAGDACEKR
jgi:hypothetical protein